jgi:spectrin beta
VTGLFKSSFATIVSSCFFLYLCCRWHDLQGALDLYRGHLARALEVHAFNRDVDDTSQRVAEKAVAMSTDDVGRDLAAVEQLQRKQEALERDMTAIEGKLKVRSSASLYPLVFCSDLSAYTCIF